MDEIQAQLYGLAEMAGDEGDEVLGFAVVALDALRADLLRAELQL